MPITINRRAKSTTLIGRSTRAKTTKGSRNGIAATAISESGDFDPLEKKTDPEQHKGQSSICLTAISNRVGHYKIKVRRPSETGPVHSRHEVALLTSRSKEKENICKVATRMLQRGVVLWRQVSN